MNVKNIASDNVTAYIRAYSKPSHEDGRSKRRNYRGNGKHEDRVLVGFKHMLPVYCFQCLTFDTETVTTPDKSLLYGFYMVTGYNRDEVLDFFLRGELVPEKRDVIREIGVFYGDDLTPEEIETIRTHAQKTKLTEIAALLGVSVQSVDMHLRIRSTAEFVEWMYCMARREHLLVIGLNLPFDLSRLLPTSSSWHEGIGKYKGAFCLELAPDKPAIRIYHVGFAKNLYSIEQSFHILGGEKIRDRAYENLHFLDLSQLSGSLLGPGGWSLHSLGVTLNIPAELRKLERPEEDYRPTPEKLTYALQDVIATYACYMRLRDLYAKHDLSSQTDVWNLVSGASLGKAYLKKIGIRSFSEQHPKFPQDVIGYAMNAFMGGRSEVGVRLKPVRGRLRDYTSEYPLACSLLGLQRYWLAEKVAVNRDALRKVQDILSLSVSDLLEYLHDPKNWKNLLTLCKVRLSTGQDRFPVRACYVTMGDDEKATANSTNIALPFVSSDADLWYCIQDVIASKLLTGCTPDVVEALEIVAGDEQYTVHPINIMGEESAHIDLTQDEFFTRIIDLKQIYGDLAKSATTPEAREYNASIKTALKLLANSTSYGSLVEVRASEPSDKPGGEEVMYYDACGKQCYALSDRIEQPGKFFSPLGPFITASGRLMIAIAERLGMDAGFGLVDELGNRSVFAFCDTDSMFYVCPDGMQWSEFVEKDNAIGEWFQALSPYANNAEVFKLEREDAYCFAVSAKRYCLYTIKEQDEEIEARVLRKVGRTTRWVLEKQIVTRRVPIMLKVSSHGLGAIQDPYERDADGRSITQFPDIPAPSPSLGVKRWVYDLFYKAVYAVENNQNIRGSAELRHNAKTGAPELSALEVCFEAICQHQITITSPHLLKTYNNLTNISPFSFFTLLPNPTVQGFMSVSTTMGIELGDALKYADAEESQRMIEETNKNIADYHDIVKAHTPLYSGSLVTSTLYPLFRCDNNEEVPECVRLRTVSDMLGDYFKHKEAKAANGDGWGVMHIRSIHITGVRYMGKEASERFEETSEEALGLIRDWDVMEYGRGDETNMEAMDMFLRKLRRFDMHDLMYISGLTRTTIEDVLNGKKRKRPTKKTVQALDKALSFIEQGGYDNSWRSIRTEEMQAVLGCDEKRARNLLNGYAPFTPKEKVLLEDWPKKLAPYHVADLVVFTGLTDTAINKMKSGKTIPTDETKIMLQRAIRSLATKPLIWRQQETATLSELLDVPPETVRLIKYGKQRLTEHQRTALLEMEVHVHTECL